MDGNLPAGWIGVGEPGDLATYVPRSPDELAPLPKVRLDGSFDWLPEPHNDLDWAIGATFEPAAIDRLETVADAKGWALPSALIAFLRSEKRNWIRSVTGCWLDLPNRLVTVPGTDAIAIRFLNDQQGVSFWYLAVSAAGDELGVVASTGLFDADEPPLADELAST